MAAVFFFSVKPGESYYPPPLKYYPPKVRAGEAENFQPSAYPVKISNAIPPILTASAAAVIDLNSGVPLFQKSSNTRMKPASITKLMTALVVLDYFKPEDIITVSQVSLAPGEAKMGLKPGDQLTVNNLLYGLLLPSGNDAAYVLAESIPGGYEQFIVSMNNRAARLNMNGTHYTNSSGKDEPNHYTTVRDLTLLAKEVLTNKLIAEIVGKNWSVVTDISGYRRYPLQNVNELLIDYWGTIGIKTGYTEEAGQCLIAAVKRNNRTILAVVLNSRDRFGDSIALFNWAFTNFRLTADKDLGK